MDPRALRIVLVVIVLAGVGTTAALITGDTKKDADVSPVATRTQPRCLPVPVKTTMPAWYPKNLPLPAGTFAAEFNLGNGPTFEQGAFVVPIPLRSFVQHVLSVWPEHGWTLGTGDAEIGEAEDTFFRPRPRITGAFRASSVLCDQDATLVIVAIGLPRAVAPVASPTGSSVPLITPTATPS